MEEKKKHKVMIGIEVILLGMIIAIIGTNAASSNPPSNGVSYSKNNQTTVEGALNDLYTKANYGNASAGQILSGKTALVGGKQVTGTMPNKGAVTKTVSPGGTYTIPAGYHNGSGKVTASTCPTCLNTSDATATARDISKGKTAYVNGNKITGTGMQGKTYEFDRKKLTVESSYNGFKNGEWHYFSSVDKTARMYFDLGFTPSRMVSCHVTLTGNFYTSNANRWDADFAYNYSAERIWYTTTLPNDVYVSNSNSVNKYRDTYTRCYVQGSRLYFSVDVIKEGDAGGNMSHLQTRADEFYLSGVLAYE